MMQISRTGRMACLRVWTSGFASLAMAKLALATLVVATIVLAMLAAAALAVAMLAVAAPELAMLAAHAAEPDTLHLTVEEAVALALRQGEAAQLARQDVRVAEAQTGVALSNALPRIDLLAGYSRNLKRPVLFFPEDDGKTRSVELGEDNEYSATLSLRQPLFSSGRLGAAHRASKERAAAARRSGDATAADVAFAVKTAYFGALVADEQVEIARLSLLQAEQRLKEIEAQVERGVVPRFDLLRAQVEVATRKPVLTRARNEASLALEALRRAVGLPLDRPVALADSLWFRPQLIPREEVVRIALDENPELGTARRELDAARFQLKAQAANDRPLVYLDGNCTWQGQTSKGLLPGDRESALSASLGLTLAWPILDGFENRYRTRQAEAAAEAARLRVQLLEESIRLEARRVWADVESTAEEIRGVRESVGLAREAYAIAEVRYRSGLSTQIEVLDAEVALNRARLELAGALYRYEIALAELEQVLGQGSRLEQDLGQGSGLQPVRGG